MISSITAKSSGTVLHLAHPLQLQQPKIFWEGITQSLQVWWWDFWSFSQRCICKLSHWCWMTGPGSCAQPCGNRKGLFLKCFYMLETAASKALHWTCWCETWMQMLKTNSVKLSMPVSWASLKDQVWIPVADCNFMLLLFLVATAQPNTFMNRYSEFKYKKGCPNILGKIL